MRKCYALLLLLLFVSGTAYGQSQPRLIINEFMYNPPLDAAGDANGDGIRSAQDDEFIELLNATPDTLDLTGWMVGDDERVDWTFPEGYILLPRETVTIFGGGDVSGLPGYHEDVLQTRVFATGDSLGNALANGGDVIVILSPDGTEDMYLNYGNKYGLGAPTTAAVEGIEFEFGVDVEPTGAGSLTRYPDGNRDNNSWVLHSEVAATDFSPATSIDGSSTTIEQYIPDQLTLIINEVLIDPPTGLAGDANNDGTRDAQGDEFVELANIGNEPFDLSGYTLGDDENYVSFTFPDGYMLGPGEFVTVFGGGYVDQALGYHEDPLQTRVFRVDSLQHGGIGNGFANGGDVILLLSPDGSYDTYLAYGGLAFQDGGTKLPPYVDFEVKIDTEQPGNADQSITRFPDGNVQEDDPWVNHSSVSTAIFSPNQTIDGRDFVPGPTPPVTVVINEILAAVDADVNGDGVASAGEDQFIELANPRNDEAVDLSGYQVGSDAGLVFTFPEGYVLQPRSFVAVFGGGDVSGLPGYDDNELETRVFVADAALGLNAAGGYAVLVSPDGRYDAYVAYGTAAGEGDPELDDVEWEFGLSTGAALTTNVSITRSPDGNFLSPDPFVPHTEASDLAYSPAQTVTGLGGMDDFVDVPHPWGTGYALAFNRYERDRVEIRTASLELPTAMEEGTIEFWFKPDSVITHDTHPPDWTYLFGKNKAGATAPGDLGIAFRRGQGNIMVYMNDEAGEQDEVFSSDNDKEIFYPRWYHLAVTWKQGEKLRLFIDGELRQEAESTMPLLGGDQVIMIGNGSDNAIHSSMEGFPGMIDELRISAVERYQGNFELQTEPFESDMYTMALYHFDEGEGDLAANAAMEGFLDGHLGGDGSDGTFDEASRPMWVQVSSQVSADRENGLPGEFTLGQNYPNPFNPVTAFEFSVPQTSDIEIGIYNVLGQRVQTLVNQPMQAGRHTVTFDGSQLASGVYFYVLRSANVHLVRKMVLLK